VASSPQLSLDEINQAHELFYRQYRPVDLITPVLYHYTTALGLVGIVESSSIYGSHISFLNDTSEVAHAYEFAEKVLEGCRNLETVEGVSGQRIYEYGRFFFQHKQILWGEPAYVTSFCESDDLLSQWRGYAMEGFAVGFGEVFANGAFSIRNRHVWKTTIRKVAYVDTDKRQELIRILRAAIIPTDEVPAGDGQLRLQNTIATVCSQYLQTWAHSVKDNAFSEEMEWRIISFQQPKGAPLKHDQDFLTRVSQGQLIPTIRLKAEAGRLLPITGVTCGPNSGKHLTETAVKLLLVSHGYTGDVVKTSRIPFRTRY
jgi:hypothetical protein